MDDQSRDFTVLDDSALLSRRAQMRAELERLPPGSPGYAALATLYDASTQEVNERARQAWSSQGRSPQARPGAGREEAR
jgi:hypothetical protein